MKTIRKPRPRVGDTCWFVSWCSRLGFYPDMPGEVDLDRCEEEVRQFATRGEAEAFARAVYPAATQTFGVVDYWPAEFVPYDEADARRYPHAGYWEPTADPEHY